MIRFAGRCREHIGSQTDDTARGNRKFEPRTVAVGFHVGQGPLAFGGQFDHCPRVLLGTIDGHLFDRFALLAVDLLDDDLGLSYLEFVTFATHGFDQHREVQHAPSEYDETVGVGSRFDAQGEVFLQLAVEALLDMAGGDVFAVLAEERRVVDREEHRHRRFVDGDRGAAVPDFRSRRSYRRFRIRRCRSGRRFHRRALHRPFFLPKPRKPSTP